MSTYDKPSVSAEISLGYLQEAHINIKNAQELFHSLGLDLQSDGLVTQYPSPEQLVLLRAWHEQTQKPSVDMPTVETFYQKVLLAVSLWRQVQEETFQYLLGKGTGVEIALRGTVKNRVKRPVTFPYRSHSDFELYGVADVSEATSAGTINTPYSEPFRFVFGNQEYYPPTKTKGLKQLPSDLMRTTAETVDLGGITVYTPQLELLFLDKYMARENTPRSEGYDAELLAQQYEMDIALLHTYLDLYVIQPAAVDIETKAQQGFENQINGIKRNVQTIIRELKEEEIIPTKENVIARLNDYIQSMIDIWGEDSSANYSGIKLNIWENLTIYDLDEEWNVIGSTYLSTLQNKINEVKTAALNLYQVKHLELDTFFNEIQKNDLN